MGVADQHDVDFYRWAQEQAHYLRAQPCDTSLLDLDNLAEEIEDMGRSEIRVISILLHQTIANLLKIALNPEASDVDYWFNEILTFQGDVVLTFSPAMRTHLDMDAIWRVACNGAARAMVRRDVAVPPLPESCPLSLEHLVDPEFDPAQAADILSEATRAPASIAMGKR